MSQEGPGIDIPISVDTDTITIEKLAAKLLELEEKVVSLGRKGKGAGEEIGKGFGQGLGQKAFETFKSFVEGIPHDLENAIHASAQWSNEMVSLGVRTGFATQQLQEYSLAAKTSGTNINLLTRAGQQLTPTLLKNSQAFAAIGLQFNDLVGLDPGEQFDKVAKALKGIDDPAKRLQAITEIFGKRLGPQLAPFINGLEEARKRAHDLGLVLSDETVKASAEFNDELDTMKETQAGLVRSFGSFITADKDLLAALKQVTNAGGDFNRWVQEVAGNFHELPAGVKVAAAGITLFGAKLVGLIPTLVSFVALAAQLKDLGLLGGIIGALAHPLTALGTAFTAVKAAALSASQALLGFFANPVVLAAIGGAVAGGALGIWLRDNVKWFHDLTDGIGDAIAAMGKFLALTPSEKARGNGPGAGLTGAAFTEAIKKANEEAAKLRTASVPGPQTAPVRVDPEDLKRAKELLGLEGQLGSIVAQRAGQIAAANQQRNQSIAQAKAEFALQTQILSDKRAAGESVNQKEFDQLAKVRDLTIQIANAQAEQAIRQAKLADRTKELDQTKQLADLEKTLSDARIFGLTAQEQIDKTRTDAITKAQQEHDLTVAKLEAEKEILGLTGKAAADKDKEIAQANAVLDKQVAIADAVAETAQAQLAWNEAKEFGIDLSERGLKLEQEQIDKIQRALKNPVALIPASALQTLDQATEKARRLGQPFEALQKSADAAFKRIEDQKVQDAIDEIGRKLRLGIILTESDLSGLIKMRDGLSRNSEKARELEAAIRKVGAAVRAQHAFEIIKSDAVQIAEALVAKEDIRLRHTKGYTEELKKQAVVQLVLRGYTEAQAQAIVEAEISQRKWNNAVNSALGLFGGILNLLEAIGVSSDSLAGKFLAIGKAALQAAEAGKAAKAAFDSGNKLQAVAAGLGTVGNIIKGAQTQDTKKGVLGGAAQGAAFGAAFGPQGAVIGAIAGGLIGFFGGSKFRKIAKDAGKVLGSGLSDETIKKIQEDSKKLGISIQNASLLNISTAIADTGKNASTFGPQIQNLIKGIADHSIPAAEGMAELAKSFSAVADEALKAGRVGDKALVGIIKQARASGVESPEIKAFVNEQLDAAAAGFNKFAALFEKKTQEQIDELSKKGTEAFAGLSDEAVKKLANDTGVIFGATFNALVSEKGIVGAVDTLKDSFDTLRKRLTETLGEEAVNQILGPFGAAFDTLGNEKLRPIFDGIDGLTQAMKGLANSGFLTIDAFTAMQHSTKTLFDEAVAGGADMKTALLAVAPGIQAAISAAEQFGVPLDADTEQLKKLAEQNGITFKTDPQQAMLDVLVSIAEVLGADIPESAKKAADSLADLKNSVPNDVQVGGGGVNNGVNGPKSVNAQVNVNLGINENPLAAADTAAAMRKATVEWTAEAIEDRIPAIIAAVEG